MKKSLLYYPLLLLLLVFALDKISLIPAIRNYGRRMSTPMENVTRSLYELRLHKKNQRSMADRKTEYLMLGTSRSTLFRFMHQNDIPGYPYINEADKKEMLKLDVETRAAYRATDLWVAYTMLDKILLSEVLPDYIVLELSPELFNRNSTHTLNLFIRNQTYDYYLLLDAYGFADGSIKRDLSYRLLFPTYAFGFRPEKALINYIKGVHFDHEAELTMKLLNSRPVMEILPKDAEKYESDPEKIPEHIWKHRFISYRDQMGQDAFLRNYEFSESELTMLDSILQKSKAAGIKVITWTPPVHYIVEEEYDKRNMWSDFQKVLATVKKHETPYKRITLGDLKCQFWSDSSHLSDLCAIELFNLIRKTDQDLDQVNNGLP